MAAGYTTSLLANAQAILAKRFEQPEFRTERYNLIRAMLQGGQNMFVQTEIDRLMTSDSRTVETFVHAKRSVTAGTARAHNHTLAAYGDTQKVTLSFSIAQGTYGIGLKQGGRNIFERSSLLASDLNSASIAINNTIEAAIATYLSTYKTQVNSADGSYSTFGTWDSDNNCWIIPEGKEDYFFQYISSIMAINDYDVPLTVVADPMAAAIAGRLEKQGAGNATNLGWQFENQQIVYSRRVTDTSFAGTCYVFPTGTVGMVNRIPTENREVVNTKLYEYTNMADPLGTPLKMATHMYEEGGTTASYGGETQDVIFQYENSTDYALVKAPISTGATYTPIFKFVLQGGGSN